MLKPTLVALSMTPVFEAVNIPFVDQSIDDEGDFVPDGIIEKSAVAMLDSLVRWVGTLAPMRG